MNNINYFTNGSSPVNFCEPDLYYYNIGEYYNTLTSFFIFFGGLYGYYRMQNIKKENIEKEYNIEIKNSSVNKFREHSKNLYLLLMGVGLGSVYFHSKMSEFSHWVDIIFISMTLLLSDYYIEKNRNNDNKFYYKCLFILHLISSIKYPSIHIFLQFMCGYNIKLKITNQLKVLKLGREHPLYNFYKSLNKKYNLISKLFLLSKIFWVIDYFGCDYLYGYHTHWIFHILIALVSYMIIDLNKIFYILKINNE
jgi:hypothetical protein